MFACLNDRSRTSDSFKQPARSEAEDTTRVRCTEAIHDSSLSTWRSAPLTTSALALPATYLPFICRRPQCLEYPWSAPTAASSSDLLSTPASENVLAMVHLITNFPTREEIEAASRQRAAVGMQADSPRIIDNKMNTLPLRRQQVPYSTSFLLFLFAADLKTDAPQ